MKTGILPKEILEAWIADGTPKYLALLPEPPDGCGYARIEMLPSDWRIETLDNGHAQLVAKVKVFGPAKVHPWTVTDASIMSSPSGTEGLLLLAVPLKEEHTVQIGQSFEYQLQITVTG